jgi:hypothetical protein
MNVVHIPATLSAFGAPPAPATATVQNQSSAERLRRTAAGFGLCAGLALVGLFIPVAHFILVPTFVGAGIAVAIVRAREDTRLLRVHGVCPRCATTQDFEGGGRFTPTRSLDCPTCHTNLTLTASTEQPAQG